MILQLLSSSLSQDEIIWDQRGGDAWITEAGYLSGDILTFHPKECCVRWYGRNGMALVRMFQLSKIPLDAIFCLLDDPSVDNGHSQKRLCIAILLSSNELLIYYATGERYEIMLPAPCKYLLACSEGLLLQGILCDIQDPVLPTEFDIETLGDEIEAFLLDTNKGKSRIENNVVLHLVSPNSPVDVISITLR